jgi:hypothetical protein
MSHCRRLAFGIVADREQVPDLWSVVGWLDEALAELHAGSAQAPSEDLARARGDG